MNWVVIVTQMKRFLEEDEERREMMKEERLNQGNRNKIIKQISKQE